eukprot:GHUV01054922.1.p1 GENE.GHUV01054922.1~~GHUV01054922.1.p1  ORF type:complete len:111 (+),score=14.51 GHUV01054922.1:366-698(+)
MSGDSAGAIRWLEVLTSLVPHDPGVLCKLGAIYHRYGRNSGLKKVQLTGSIHASRSIDHWMLGQLYASASGPMHARVSEYIKFCFVTAGWRRKPSPWATTKMHTESGQST